MILCPVEIIPPEQLPTEIRTVQDDPGAASETHFNVDDYLLGVERQLVIEALERASGRKAVAAKRLGISRHALKRKLQKLGLGTEDADDA